MNSRLVLLALLVLAVAGGVMLLSGEPDKPVGPPDPPRNGQTGEGEGETPVTGASLARATPFTNAAECADCHQEVYAEWKGSYHGMAWTDPMVQALSNGFRMTECIDCHAPQPIHITGVDKRVAPRQHSRQDGVDCLTCHLLPDGISVAATRDVDTSAVAGACRPVKTDSMSVSTSCAGCHNQHETVDELLASGVDAECQTCHMPEVQRGQGDDLRPGRSHVFPGAHSEEMHRKALDMKVRVEGGKVVTDITNVGAAHKVPTDARHRSYNVWVSAWDSRGNPFVADQEIHEIRLYYRDDFRPSTQISHNETRTVDWEIPEGFKGRVEVKLTYALNPEELAAKRVFDVHSMEVEVQ